MNGEYLILSDIHGNCNALKKILESVQLTDINGIIILGDIIDYGARSNEVISLLSEIPKEYIIVNIFGNHEEAILMNNFDRFSSLRGIQSAQYTSSILTKESREYLEKMSSSGKAEFSLAGRSCLAVHGSLNDCFWKSIDPEEVEGYYMDYDYVFSGHSHIPHAFYKFYSNDDQKYRNKKRTLFINPGSVGQPRNHNPNASFAVLNIFTEAVKLMNVRYDIEEEQNYFTREIDEFYKVRLERGI
ncbi:metallophosphoesterase family protein [Anaerocolumna sp. AGMB13020]|uniref:metallophosphoesterase family protein n=1 Tax=Anaerocolumna sp. AGMB13020 TaxID=3081750 RepID=UPI0029553C9D|nr:metallophosphoesterase family protein [Anaerocolumna sp. AGMB13020]WOO35155.1 metallophosphoesterase family protein [Anaerocolumna sp. AGMB13020]